MKSSRLLALVLGAALAFLALASSPQAPPKSPPPSGVTPAQTEERIKQLEARADAAEKAAASAAMEKDYLARVQKQYESYYERAFNTMLGIVGIIALIIAVISWATARFSLDFFDRRVQAAVTKAQEDVTATINIELGKLRNENAAQTKELDTALTAKIAQVDQDLKDRSTYQFCFAQALAAGADERFDDARISFREALKLYKAFKPRQLFKTTTGALVIRNIFVSIEKQHPDAHQERAKEELTDPLYNHLHDELAGAALEIPWLALLINERMQNSPTPPAPPPPPKP